MTHLGSQRYQRNSADATSKMRDGEPVQLLDPATSWIRRPQNRHEAAGLDTARVRGQRLRVVLRPLSLCELNSIIIVTEE